jgi:hypothetical protein
VKIGHAESSGGGRTRGWPSDTAMLGIIVKSVMSMTCNAHVKLGE